MPFCDGHLSVEGEHSGDGSRDPDAESQVKKLAELHSSHSWPSLALRWGQLSARAL